MRRRDFKELDGRDAAAPAETYSADKWRGYDFAQNPTTAMTFKPVWAWLYVHGLADCFCKPWASYFRGALYVHAGKFMTYREYEAACMFAASIDKKVFDALPAYKKLMSDVAGGIVGRVDVVDILPTPPAGRFTSPWHVEGSYAYMLARPVEFGGRIATRGALGFFTPDALAIDLIKKSETR